MADDAKPDLRTWLLVAIVVILGGWALKALAIVLIPLAASLLIALGVMPLRDRVAARLPPRWAWLGVAAAMAVVLLVLACFFGGLYLAGRQLAAQVPEATEQVTGMLGGEAEAAPEEGVAASAQAGAEEQVADEGGPAEGGRAEGGGGNVLRQVGDQLLGAAGGAAGAVLNAGVAVLGGLVITFFLTLLILIESGQWAAKARRAAGARAEWRLSESAEVVAEKFRAYVLLQAALGAGSAVLYAVWLWIFGVDLILVWALLTFLMNFVPNLGSIVAGVTTTAYAFVTKDAGTAALVGAGILAIEQVMGNLVGPRLQGRNIALSPLVVLVALVFWSWAWGVAGALLAVPATFALVVLMAHVPALRPWALMLTDQTSMAGLDEATRPKDA